MPRRSASKTASRGSGNRVLGFLLGLINPLHDPSLTVAIILTVIEELGSSDPVWRWALMLVLNWVAVKAVVWVVVNFAFAMAFLARKGWWALHNPKLAWRVLDALGTEDIIVGPIRELLGQEGSMALSENGVLGALPALGGLTGGMPMLAQQQMYDDQPPSYERHYQDDRSAEELDHLRGILATYARLVADWSAATDEKWRTISDSQLGWKPLRGRWSNWDEIYAENFSTRTSDPIASRAAQLSAEAASSRYESARDRGSAASSVVCFLRDLDTLRQSLLMLDLPEDVQQVNDLANSGIFPMGSRSQANVRSPLIRRPAQIYVDAE